MLARARKEVLIKAVALSIPSMSAFQLPLKLFDDLDALCARFWWDKLGMKGKFIQRVGIN